MSVSKNAARGETTRTVSLPSNVADRLFPLIDGMSVPDFKEQLNSGSLRRSSRARRVLNDAWQEIPMTCTCTHRGCPHQQDMLVDSMKRSIDPHAREVARPSSRRSSAAPVEELGEAALRHCENVADTGAAFLSRGSVRAAASRDLNAAAWLSDPTIVDKATKAARATVRNAPVKYPHLRQSPHLPKNAWKVEDGWRTVAAANAVLLSCESDPDLVTALVHRAIDRDIPRAERELALSLHAFACVESAPTQTKTQQVPEARLPAPVLVAPPALLLPERSTLVGCLRTLRDEHQLALVAAGMVATSPQITLLDNLVTALDIHDDADSTVRACVDQVLVFLSDTTSLLLRERVASGLEPKDKVKNTARLNALIGNRHRCLPSDVIGPLRAWITLSRGRPNSAHRCDLIAASTAPQATQAWLSCSAEGTLLRPGQLCCDEGRTNLQNLLGSDLEAVCQHLMHTYRRQAFVSGPNLQLRAVLRELGVEFDVEVPVDRYRADAVVSRWVPSCDRRRRVEVYLEADGADHFQAVNRSGKASEKELKERLALTRSRDAAKAAVLEPAGPGVVSAVMVNLHHEVLKSSLTAAKLDAVVSEAVSRNAWWVSVTSSPSAPIRAVDGCRNLVAVVVPAAEDVHVRMLINPLG